MLPCGKDALGERCCPPASCSRPSCQGSWSGPAEAASAWRAEVRSTDLLARYGGEEFELLLPACALEDAIRIETA